MYFGSNYLKKVFMQFIRLIDIVFVVLLLLPALFICPLIAIIIYCFDGVNPLFSQVRLSKDKKQFTMYKFRTMSLETLNMPTHELSSQYFKVWKNFKETKI